MDEVESGLIEPIDLVAWKQKVRGVDSALHQMLESRDPTKAKSQPRKHRLTLDLHEILAASDPMKRLLGANHDGQMVDL